VDINAKMASHMHQISITLLHVTLIGTKWSLFIYVIVCHLAVWNLFDIDCRWLLFYCHINEQATITADEHKHKKHAENRNTIAK